jgi:ribosomal protein L11 methyltransferase
MEWLEFCIDTTHESSEVISDFLSSLGADGVQVEDAQEIIEILQSPDSLSYADDEFLNNLDEIVHIKAYFAGFDEGIRVNREISLHDMELYDDMPKRFIPFDELESIIRDKLAVIGQYLNAGPGYIGCRKISEEDWAEGWKKYYTTVKLTDRLVINPSWIDYQPLDGEIVISLDPGSAFGTGTHETTILCARMLDRIIKPGNTLLDLGCGSGILAIIAARLGCGDVEAIDIDPLAVNVAKENAMINGADIYCHQGELKDARLPEYDLIAANIIADVIALLAPDFPVRMKPGGLLVVSGIIAEKAQKVIEACSRSGLELLESEQQNDWCAFLWRRLP